MRVYTYLIKSEQDGSYYVGISKDTNIRLAKHNKGDVASTRNKKPWQIVYQKEHDCYEIARRHEKWLKKKNREYKDTLTLK